MVKAPFGVLDERLLGFVRRLKWKATGKLLREVTYGDIAEAFETIFADRLNMKLFMGVVKLKREQRAHGTKRPVADPALKPILRVPSTSILDEEETEEGA